MVWDTVPPPENLCCAHLCTTPCLGHWRNFKSTTDYVNQLLVNHITISSWQSFYLICSKTALPTTVGQQPKTTGDIPAVDKARGITCRSKEACTWGGAVRPPQGGCAGGIASCLIFGMCWFIWSYCWVRAPMGIFRNIQIWMSRCSKSLR